MDLMTLAAKLTLDAGAYEKGIKNAESSFGRLGNKIESAGKTISARTIAIGTLAGRMLERGINASFKAVSGVIKKSTEAFASYEQLVGGVKTLFGTREISNARDYAKQIGLITEKTDKAGNKILELNKKIAKSFFNDPQGKKTRKMTADEAAELAFAQAQEAQKNVLDNANKAFMTAGVSMNHYMETATSFAASMSQATGGDTLKSAALVDLAIRDMADNANKMGTSMEAVENAYKGFSKGNYTMLDNLKLGYGGTKTEMQRLLKDASEITGEKYQIGNMADMVKAINAIQQKQGITGTTEKEARGTIEGSKNMLKAAWENVLTALAAPEDLDLSGAIKSLTEGAKTYLNNVFPVISTVMDGLGTFIDEVMPDVMEKLPELIADFAPKLLKAGKKMLEGFGRGLKKAAKGIKMPTWSDVKGVATSAWNTVTKGFEGLAKLAFGEKVDGTINWPTWGTIKTTLTNGWDIVKGAFTKLLKLSFGTKVDGSINWPTWDTVGQFAEDAWRTIVNGVGNLVNTVGSIAFGVDDAGNINWPDWDAVKEAAENAWKSIREGVRHLADTVGRIAFGERIDGSINWPTWAEIQEAVTNAWNGIIEGVEKLVPIVFGENTVISNSLTNALHFFQDFGNWVIKKADSVGAAIGIIAGAFAAIKIAEFASSLNIVKLILLAILAIAAVVIANWDKVKETVQNVVEWIQGQAEAVGQWFTDNLVTPITNFIEKVKEAVEWVKTLLHLRGEEKGEGGVLSEDQKEKLAAQYQQNELTKKNLDWVGDYEASKTIAEGLDASFAEQLKAELLAAGAAEEDIITAQEMIANADNPAWVSEFNEGLHGAEAVSSQLVEAIASIVGEHEIKFKITVEGHVPSFDGGEGGNAPGNAKGMWSVPYDDYLTRLHRNEMVLTASQARKYKEGQQSADMSGLAAQIVGAIREGMSGARVNSFLDGKDVTGDVNRRTSNRLKARRFKPA